MCNTEIIYHATSNVDLFFFFLPFFVFFFFVPWLPAQHPVEGVKPAGPPSWHPGGTLRRTMGSPAPSAPSPPSRTRQKVAGLGTGGHNQHWSPSPGNGATKSHRGRAAAGGGQILHAASRSGEFQPVALR